MINEWQTDTQVVTTAIPEYLVDLLYNGLPGIDIAIVGTDLEGVVTKWNRFAERLLEYGREEVVGVAFASLDFGPLQSEVLDDIRCSLARGVPWAGRCLTKRRDGVPISLSVAVFHTCDERGRLVGTVSILREDADELEASLKELSDLRHLAHRLDEVRYETARDIAGRLHDDLSHQCHELLAQVHDLLSTSSLSSELRAKIEDVEVAQRRLVASLQSIWRSLRPPLLDEFGARAALENLAASVQSTGIIEMDVAIDDEVDDVRGPVREIIVLIVQEALSNVMSHSQATKCSLSVTVENETVTLEVTDNGVGYHAKEGFGLRLMRERIKRFGGTHEIGPGPAGGTSILAQLSMYWEPSAPLESLLDPHVMLRAVRDDDGGIVDFVFIEANHSALIHHRSSREQLIGRRLLETPGATSLELFHQYVHTVETGEPLILNDYEFSNEGASLSTFYDIRAVKVGDALSHTWRDVTERHQSLRHFRLLAENTTDVVLLLTPQRLIEWASPSIKESLGYEPAEVVGRPFRTFWYHDDDVTFEARRDEFARNGHFTFEEDIRHADGSFQRYEVAGRHVFDASGTLMARVASLRNIDNEYQARAALERSEARLRLLAENASDVVFQAELSGVIRWVSPSVTKVLGWAVEELTDHHYGFMAHPDDEYQANEGDPVEPPDFDATSFDIRLRSASGEFRWFNMTIKIIDDEEVGGPIIVGSMRDIDNDRLTRLALEASEARFRRIAETAPDVFFELSPAGDIVWVSETVVGELGWSMDEVKDAGLDGLIHEDDLADTRQYVALVFAGGNSQGVDVRVAKRDGRWPLMALHAKPMRSPDGTISGIAVALRREVGVAYRDDVLAREGAVSAQ